MPLKTEEFFCLGRHDNTFWRGAYAIQVLVSTLAIWDATIKRYARLVGVANGARAFYYRAFLEPRALADPRYGLAPIKTRIRETLLCTYGAFGNTTHDALYEWGLSASTTTAAGGAQTQGNLAYMPFIGFRAYFHRVFNGATPVLYWRTYFTDPDNGVLRQTITSFDAKDIPRDLMIELDSETGTVNWYIDGTLVDSYTPASGEWPGQGAAIVIGEWRLHYIVSAVSGATAPNLTASLYTHMGPCSPSGSMEYVDDSVL
jgi:hypothetical protein